MRTLFYGISTSFLLLFCQCRPPSPPSLQDLAAGAPAIGGRAEYLASPYVAAGDRLYMVGHQDGSFPDLGWHVTGEMGGIWDHPIKLMDGFTAALQVDGQTHCLTAADTFINYPFANLHRYETTPAGIAVDRFQFVPDSLEAVVVEYTLRNPAADAKALTFVFTGLVDLRPVWLGERTGMTDGGDYVFWQEDARCLVGKDSLNDWYVAWGSPLPASGQPAGEEVCPVERRGKGAAGVLSFDVNVPAGGTAVIPIVIAGSYASLDAAVQTLSRVQSGAASLLQRKKDRYEGIRRTARVTVPDPQLQQALEWVKYNTDWLMRDVPAIGRGLSAGLPDYPWWFGCDNTYSLQGALATGRADVARSTMSLLQKLSEETNGNGRVVHEVSTNSAVFNPGNINETPHFASMVWTLYEWTGDRELLEQFFPMVKKGLAWLLAARDADGNLCPDGFGMMEIHGLDSEMIDVAVYTQQAFADAASMAEELGDTALAAHYRQIAGRLRERINTDFWVPEFNSYADFIGTAAQARRLIDDAIVRADTLGKPWAVEELKATRDRIAGFPPNEKRGYVLYHNWVVNTPMEMGIADPDKALAALQTGSRFVNPFGVFVTGIDRDETAGTDEGSFAARKKIFSYVGAVMTLPTGVQAIAENNYGRPDAALDYLRRLTRSFSFALPGSMYEVSPDFGMMTQAWNVYALATPVVRQFFGIRPQAHQATVRIQPQMPSAWNDAALDDLPIGGNTLSMHFQRNGNGQTISLEQTLGGWELEVAFPAGQFRTWRLNGKAVTPATEGGYDVLRVQGTQAVMEVE